MSGANHTVRPQRLAGDPHERESSNSSGELTVLSYLALPQNWPESLKKFHIQLLFAADSSGAAHVARGGIALVAAPSNDPSKGASLETLSSLRNEHQALVLVVQKPTQIDLTYIRAGVDGIAVVSEPVERLAATLWAIHQFCLAQQLWQDRVNTLQRRIDQMKLIGQAKAIVAEHLNISEAAALRHLRSEARNRRRPLHQIASVVLEARKIMHGSEKSTNNNSSEETA